MTVVKMTNMMKNKLFKSLVTVKETVSAGCRMCVIVSLVKLLNANCRHVLQTVRFLDESFRDLLTSMLPNALMHWSLRNVYNMRVNTFCPQASYFVYFLLGMIVNLFIHSFTHPFIH